MDIQRYRQVGASACAAVHPGESDENHELYLMCEDVEEAARRALQAPQAA